MTKYIRLMRELGDEKQVVVYALDPALQTAMDGYGWTGRVPQNVEGDYLMWVDANLGALKTDHVMKRTLSYEIDLVGDRYQATAAMEYEHQGTFDWRTTRYLSYMRVFAPSGSELKAMYRIENGNRTQIFDIDSGNTSKK